MDLDNRVSGSSLNQRRQLFYFDIRFRDGVTIAGNILASVRAG